MEELLDYNIDAKNLWLGQVQVTPLLLLCNISHETRVSYLLPIMRYSHLRANYR